MAIIQEHLLKHVLKYVLLENFNYYRLKLYRVRITPDNSGHLTEIQINLTNSIKNGWHSKIYNDHSKL